MITNECENDIIYYKNWFVKRCNKLSFPASEDDLENFIERVCIVQIEANQGAISSLDIAFNCIFRK